MVVLASVSNFCYENSYPPTDRKVLGNRFSTFEDDEFSGSPGTGNFPGRHITVSERQANSGGQDRDVANQPLNGERSDDSDQSGNDGFSLEVEPLSKPTHLSGRKLRLPVCDIPQVKDMDANRKPWWSLREYTIPSPLLYHKRSREDLFGNGEDKDRKSEGRLISIGGPDRPRFEYEFDTLGSRSLSGPGGLHEGHSQSPEVADPAELGLIGMTDAQSPIQHQTHGPRTNMSKSPPVEYYETYSSATTFRNPQPQPVVQSSMSALLKEARDINPGEFALQSSTVVLPSSTSTAAHAATVSNCWDERTREDEGERPDTLAGAPTMSSPGDVRLPPRPMFEQGLGQSSGQEKLSSGLTSPLASRPGVDPAFPIRERSEDLIEVGACPTMACTGLFGKLTSLHQQHHNMLGEEPDSRWYLAAISRIASDLGFSIAHGEGCGYMLGLNERRCPESKLPRTNTKCTGGKGVGGQINRVGDDDVQNLCMERWPRDEEGGNGSKIKGSNVGEEEGASSEGDWVGEGLDFWA